MPQARRAPPRGGAGAAATTTTMTRTTTTTTQKKATVTKMSVAERRRAAEQREAERRQQELRDRGIDPERVKARAGTFLKRGQGRRVKERSSAEKAEDLRRKEEARAIRQRERGQGPQALGRPPALLDAARRTPVQAQAEPQVQPQTQQVIMEVPVELVVSQPGVSPERPPAEPSPVRASPQQAVVQARTPPPPAVPPEVTQTLENVLQYHEYIEKVLTLRHIVRQQRFRRRFMTSALVPVEPIDQEEEEREIDEEVQRLMAAQVPGKEVIILPPEEERPRLPDLSPRFKAKLEGGEGFLEQEAPAGVRERTPSPRLYQLPQPPRELEDIVGMLWQCKQILKRQEFAALIQRIQAPDFKIDSDLESIPSSEYDSEGDLSKYDEPGAGRCLEVSPRGRGPAARALERLLNS